MQNSIIKHDTIVHLIRDTTAVLIRDTTTLLVHDTANQPIKSVHCWELISPIIVTLGFCMAVMQFKRLVKTNKLDLYYRLKNDFYSDRSQKLSGAIVDDNLILEVIDNRPIIKKKIKDETGKEILEELSIDLLDHLDDLYFFYREGLTNLKHIDQGYGTIIKKTHLNKVIRDFIEKLRAVDGEPEYYIGVEKLYYLIVNRNSGKSLMCALIERLFIRYCYQKYLKLKKSSKTSCFALL